MRVDVCAEPARPYGGHTKQARLGLHAAERRAVEYLSHVGVIGLGLRDKPSCHVLAQLCYGVCPNYVRKNVTCRKYFCGAQRIFGVFN